ncbi:MAG: lysophospholipid acyltransferase family protein [Desulfomicrobium sp.]
MLRLFLHNIGFYLGFLLLNLSILIASLPLYITIRLTKKNNTGQAIRQIIWFYGRLWIILTSFFTKIEINTRKKIDYPAPCIILVNHQSFFDAFCMGALPIYNIVFLVRSWPFKIPFYGHYMRNAEYINSENISCEEFVREAKQRLKQGTSILIFPEGTRSQNGQLGRFYSGAFKLAMASKIPIVPICIDGTGKFLPKGKFWVKPNPISITTLSIIDPIKFEHYGQKAHIELRKAAKITFIEALE